MVAVGSRSKKLSKAVYLALKVNSPMPWEYVRVTMCERFGWKLEYFDALDVHEVHEVLAVWDGMDKAKTPPTTMKR